MALTVNMQAPCRAVAWKDAKRGSVYRCTDNHYLVICNQSNQATGLGVSGAASRLIGDTWSPGSESKWIEVNATVTVDGDV